MPPIFGERIDCVSMGMRFFYSFYFCKNIFLICFSNIMPTLQQNSGTHFFFFSKSKIASEIQLAGWKQMHLGGNKYLKWNIFKLAALVFVIGAYMSDGEALWKRQQCEKCVTYGMMEVVRSDSLQHNTSRNAEHLVLRSIYNAAARRTRSSVLNLLACHRRCRLRGYFKGSRTRLWF